MALREITFDNNDQFGFWRAAMGEHEPIPPFLFNETACIPNRDDIVLEAAEALFVAAKLNSYARPKGYRAPLDIIAAGMGLDPERATLAPREVRLRMWYMASLTLLLAKQDVRYWGVEDVSVERYCSTCRLVQPAKEFTVCDYICNGCASPAKRRRAA